MRLSALAVALLALGIVLGLASRGTVFEIAVLTAGFLVAIKGEQLTSAPGTWVVLHG